MRLYPKIDEIMKHGLIHYSVDVRIQTCTEPVPLKYGQLTTKYPWIYGYSLQCRLLSFGVKLNFHEAIFLVVTSRACRARGLFRTTPTHGQTGSTTPQQTAGAWQAGRESRRTRPTCYGDVTRKTVVPWNLS